MGKKKKIQKKAHEETSPEPNGLVNKIEHLYNKEYKKLVVIPTIIALIAFALIFMQFMQTGDFIHKGISLKGGTTVRIGTNLEVDAAAFESVLINEYPGEEFSVRVLRSQGTVEEISIETSMMINSADSIIPFIEQSLNEKLSDDDYSIQTIGSTLSESFFSEILKILLLAFFLMGFIVFIYFRSLIPSLGVVLAALFDMIITLAVINFLGIKISTAGIAAFLMLIGYSIDTDTMLTARVLKRTAGTSVFDAVKDAFKTGMTMSAAALGATFSAYLFATSAVIKQIMIILVIGLIVDIFTTWVQNAALLKWYVEAKGK